MDSVAPLYRVAEPGDLLLAQSVYTASARMPDAGEWSFIGDELIAGNRALIMAQTSNGTPIGIAQVNFHPKYSLFRRLGIPEIQDLLVAPDYRRHGVGAGLIAFCEDVIRQRGKAEAGISFGLSPSYGPAQRLYVRMGYVPDGQGVVYDRQVLKEGDTRPLDDNLCLMLVKTL